MAAPPPAAASSGADQTAMFRQYCFTCHGKAGSAGGLNLEQLLATPPGEPFLVWEKVAAAIENKRMPPPKLPQPSESVRAESVSWIRQSLKAYAVKHAGDPGKVTVRRLTSGEYGYSIQDLTGIDVVKIDRDFVADSVGGEGFTNFGDVQFMQDASLERYLQTAKLVANHAVIGAGPLGFYPDAGKSGMELSAIHRIQEIYKQNGFRSASGEGGKPYGVHKYGDAILALWKYEQQRAKRGETGSTLAAIAARDGVSVRFAEHLWQVFHEKTPSYPSSEVVTRWNKVAELTDEKAARAASTDLQNYIVGWPRFLFGAGAPAEGGLGDERALVITDASIHAGPKQRLRFGIIVRGRDQKKFARVYLSTASVNPTSTIKPVVTWRNATLRVRTAEKAFGPPFSLASAVDEETAKRLGFGANGLAAADFRTEGEVSTYFDIPLKEAGGSFDLQVTPEIGEGDGVVRCVLADKEDISKGRPISVLVANTSQPSYAAWKSQILHFANNLPSASHGEPTPADKDEIPDPYDNTYNQPERDSYHVKVKYYRTDRFVYEKMLDDASRKRLDAAWVDLLGSFEYHDAILSFVVGKFKVEALKGKTVADLDEATIRSLPAEPRKYIEPLRREFLSVRDAQLSAQPGHVNDCLELASKAWRRPLTEPEKQGLRAFYKRSREQGKLDHDKAIRALVSRILVSPAFLYRLEQTAAPSSNPAAGKQLTNWEIASRLSFFLWSSIPDEELRRAAAANELADDAQLRKQVKRMLTHPKARRFSNEFFGQWLGFYRFDQFTGVDNTRFPEFNDEIKAAMYDEAVSFFEYVVRENRPVNEILTANYTFLNQPLAKHYGVKQAVKPLREVVKVENAENRGGALRLGAVLASTSAPLRTSPVKRGDWLLRRILGTPTPPPPADAGSLPADEKAFGGLSLREKLASHQRNASCAGCHSRIDPLGFPMEKYDPVGRVRETYSDGKPVLDTGTTADNTNINGVDGLIQYLQKNEDKVLSNMSRKILGYALGRTTLASDQLLVDRMVKAGNHASVADLVAEVVTSRQFRYRREGEGSSIALNRLAKEGSPTKP